MLAVIFIILVIAFAVLQMMFPGFWKWIPTAYKAVTSTEENLALEIKDTQDKRVEDINKFGFEIGKEDASKLNSGEYTEEQMKDIILGIKPQDTNSEPTGTTPENTEISENTENNPSSDNKQDNTVQANPDDSQNKPAQNNDKINGTSKPQTPSYTKDQERIAELVAQMYVMKANYTAKVEGIVASMIADYSALPEEKRTTGAKTNIAKQYLGTINSLEAQCDAQVNSVVTELRAILKASGSDQQLADSIVAAYNAEKESTKAFYLNKYS